MSIAHPVARQRRNWSQPLAFPGCAPTVPGAPAGCRGDRPSQYGGEAQRERRFPLPSRTCYTLQENGAAMKTITIEQARGQGFSPSAESLNPTTDFHGFVARASAAKAMAQEQPPTERESWHDPDPAAIGAVSPDRHPVTYLLASRQGRGEARRSARYRVRWCLSVLTGQPARTLTLDDAMAHPWHHVSAEQARAYRQEVLRRYPGGASRQALIDTLRRITEGCLRARLINAAQRDEVIDQLPYAKAQPSRRRRRRLDQDEIATAALACTETVARNRVRNTTIVVVLASSGIRGCEVVNLDLDDWDRDNGMLLLRDTKNKRSHLVPLHPTATEHLEVWLATRGDAPGPLFNKSDGGRLKVDSMRHAIQLRAQKADLEAFGLHDLRRTFASELLRTHDIALVSRLLNHTSIASTMVYDLASEAEQLAAVSTLTLPPTGSTLTRPVQARIDGTKESQR